MSYLIKSSFSSIFLLSTLMFSVLVHADDESVPNEAPNNEALENDCYEMLQPRATFTSSWSTGDRDSGILGFVIEKVDSEIGEIKGKLYDPASPRKARPFDAVLQFTKNGAVMNLKSDPENGLVDKRCTTSTARQFLRKGNRAGFSLKLEEDHWVSAESGSVALDFRPRGIGNYAKRLEAFETSRKELETKIFDTVKESAVYSGSWTSEDGKTGNISLQFGSDPTIDDEYHIVGKLFDMEEPHKSKPFTGSVALGEDSAYHFTIKATYKKGTPRSILKTESQRFFLDESIEYDLAFVLGDEGIDGESSNRFKLSLKPVAPKTFKEKMEAIKVKDEARRAAIIAAVKPRTVYKGVWTDSKGKTGEMGFLFKTISDEGYAITGELIDPVSSDLRKPFEGQLSLGPDSPNSIEFKSLYRMGVPRPQCKSETASIFLDENFTRQFHFSLSESGLTGVGDGYKLELTKP